ncbi:hypothetical protein [Compostimonas suwonensis]|uniref:Uncharacterized protein n=1 Tax=Compostimonas suwonensis TaxID=1048394 RepID=A0A2M9BUW8_9MICO|nr:hypothetical protein [Compostimonas suwonensis]PJJ61741.1 hypothetical protein CLV54_2691 [Compostimonas suwonensis]
MQPDNAQPAPAGEPGSAGPDDRDRSSWAPVDPRDPSAARLTELLHERLILLDRIRGLEATLETQEQRTASGSVPELVREREAMQEALEEAVERARVERNTHAQAVAAALATQAEEFHRSATWRLGSALVKPLRALRLTKG